MPPSERGLYAFGLYNVFDLYWPVSLAATGLWIWMLIDCARNEPDRVWLWVIIFLGPLGGVIYFVARKLPMLDLPTPVFLKSFGRRKEVWAAEAAARNIGNPYQYLQLGELYRELGRNDESLTAFQTALDKEPDNAQALWGVAQLLMYKQQFAVARGHLEKLLEMDPHYKYGEVYLAYGRALIALGEKDAAREHLAGNIRRWSYPEAHVLLASLLAEAGNQSEARRYLETVVYDMRAAPDFSLKRNRRWVRKAKSLLKQIG